MTGPEATRQQQTPPADPCSYAENARPARTPGSYGLREEVTKTFSRKKGLRDRPVEQLGSPAGNDAAGNPTPQPGRAAAALKSPFASGCKETKRKQPGTPATAGKPQQVYINAGQRHFDQKTCAICNLVYAPGDPQDEAQHRQFHAAYVAECQGKGPKAQGLQDEKVLSRVAGQHRMVMVDNEHPRDQQKKLREISNFMNKQLNLTDPNWLLSGPSKVFLYIRGSRAETEHIVGVAVAQRIQRAHCAHVPQQPNLQPNVSSGPGTVLSAFAQRCGGLASPGGAAGMGFVADSTDAAGQAQPAGCCTPAQRGLAAGEAASPSGASPARVRDAPTAAGALQHLPVHSSAKRLRTASIRQYFHAGRPGPSGSALQPAASGVGEPASPLPGPSATAADGEVTSPLLPRQPLAPLLQATSPLPAVSQAGAAGIADGRPPPAAAAAAASAAAAAESLDDVTMAEAGPITTAAAATAMATTMAPEVTAACGPGTPAKMPCGTAATPRHATAAVASTSQRQQQQRQRRTAVPGSLVVDLGAAERAVCGVRLVWVAPDHRRRGIAGQLLDAIRANLVIGYVVPPKSVAFSQLTADGMGFARAYTGRDDVLVYV